MKKNILIFYSIILLSFGQCLAITIEEIKNLEDSITTALKSLGTLQEKYTNDGDVAYLDDAKKPIEKINSYLQKLEQGYQSLPKPRKERAKLEQKLDIVFIKTAIALEENFTRPFKSIIDKLIPSRDFDPREYSQKIEKLSEEFLALTGVLNNIHEDFKAGKNLQKQKELVKISIVIELIKTKLTTLFDYLLALPLLAQENKNKIIENVKSNLNTSFNIVNSFEDDAFKKEVISQLKPLVTDLKKSPFMQTEANAKAFSELSDAFEKLYTQPELSMPEPSAPAGEKLPSLAEFMKEGSDNVIADIKTLSDLETKFQATGIGSPERQITLDEMKKLVNDNIAPYLNTLFENISGLPELQDKDKIIASSKLAFEELIAFFSGPKTPSFAIAVIKELIPIMEELKNKPVMQAPESQNFKDFFGQFDGMLYTEIAKTQMAQEEKSASEEAQMNISDLNDFLDGLYVNLTALRNVL